MRQIMELKQKFDIRAGIALTCLATTGLFIFALAFEIIDLGQEKSKFGFSIIGTFFIIVAIWGIYYRFGRSIKIEGNNLIVKRLIGSKKYNIRDIKEIIKM